MFSQRCITMPRAVLTRLPCVSAPSRSLSFTVRNLSDTSNKENSSPGHNQQTRDTSGQSPSDPNKQQASQPRKTVAQADDELKERLEQMSGGGGAAGIEYEDGQPNTMKRSVRNNMFRYI